MEKVLFFDGKCLLCNGFVSYLYDRDKKQKLMFSSLQSNYASSQLSKEMTNDLKTLVYKRGDKLYLKSTAVIWAMVDSSIWLKILLIYLIIPRFIRNFIYTVIAKNRYRWFGTTDKCLLTDSKRILK